MAELIRSYIVPLRKGFSNAPKYKRTPRAVREMYTFISRHMKSEDVRLTPELNNLIWLHGIRNPPPKVHVDCKKDDKGVVVVQLHGKPFPVKEEKAEEGIGSKLMEKIRGKATPKKEAKSDEKKADKVVDAEVKPKQKVEAPPAAHKPAHTEKAKDDKKDAGLRLNR